MSVPQAIRDTLRSVAACVTGSARRSIQAWAAQTYCHGSPRHTPPYHSKYNPVERCWSALERRWNGALLTTIETPLKWVATMTWKQLRPIVWMLDNQYQRGKKLTKSQMKTINQRLHRLTGLERWCVMIRPVVVQMA